MLTGAFLVSVAKAGVASYRLVLLSQNGAQINALNVLNGYPQVPMPSKEVVRNGESNVTPDFNGLWTLHHDLAVAGRAAGRRHAPDHGRHKPARMARRRCKACCRRSPAACCRYSRRALYPARYRAASVGAGLQRAAAAGGAVGHRGHDHLALQLLHRSIDEGISPCFGNWAWSTASSNILLNQVVFAPNSASITPLVNGPFTVTARCTAEAEAMPVSTTLSGAVQ